MIGASVFHFLCIQSKIKKRSWVLHECLERVPENVDAAKELLQYGLKGTDLEALLAIGRGVDDGRLVTEGLGRRSAAAVVNAFKLRRWEGQTFLCLGYSVMKQLPSINAVISEVPVVFPFSEMCLHMIA